MKNFIIPSLFVLTIFACGQPDPTAEFADTPTVTESIDQQDANKDFSYLDDEIANLSSNVQIREYWETIEAADQLYRRGEANLLQRHGYNSKEYQEMKQKMAAADAENFEKAERMLAKYGYPRRDSLGPRAANAAYLVMTHVPDYEYMERNFKYFYGAYKNGSLKEGPFSFLVNRMYDLKMGKYYEVSGTFNDADRINGIIGELGLLK